MNSYNLYSIPLAYTFDMYNDLTSTKYTVDNKKIEGDASYSPGSSQVISAGEMSTMTVCTCIAIALCISNLQSSSM